jgi:diaminopropionate ammonia-lyase
VAWSSRIFGQKARIFMPSATVKSRIKFIEDEGAEVIVIDGDYDEAVRAALKESRKKNHVLLQDTSWTGYEHYPELISAGYTTILKELEYQLLSLSEHPVDVVILQSGVGSWAASTILYLALFHKNKDIKTIILEPCESDCLLESAKNGTRSTTLKSQNTIMAGLNCGTPSLSAWKIISDLADAFLAIDDIWSEEAIRILNRAGIESCESGAAGLGGLMALFNQNEMAPFREKLKITKETRFLIFNTEGITDPEMYEKIINCKS